MITPKKHLSKELKSEILSESYKPGIICSEVAERYGISRKQLYKWRHGSKDKKPRIAGKSSEVVNFVEIVKSEKKLEKISITINEIEITIVGGISSSSLGQIINTLEAAC